MKARHVKLLGLLLVVQVVALEVLLSVYFFHRRSEYPSAILHYASFTLERLTTAPARESLGIFDEHPLFGYAPKPNSSGRHTSSSFDVTYTIGGEGERQMPTPASPKGKVLLIGDSFTFGFGVEDDETYPYFLAEGAWKQWHVVNKAVNGWGTVHSYRMMKQSLEGAALPDAVIYGMIPDHVCRNYLRPAWLQMLADSARKHPHFEIVEGRLEFRGTVGTDAAVQDESLVRQKELALTEAFLAEMQRLATEKDVPFFVVLLPQKFAVACGPVDWPPRLIRILSEIKATVVDLSEIKPRVEWLEQDVHPTANGQRTLAEAIAGSVITQELERLAAQ